MGKNTIGGNKRRRGKRTNDENTRETVFKEDGMGYGYVQKTYGNGRFQIICEDKVTRLGILRGSLRKKVWIISGDVVLYGIREFQAEKIDIVHKYTTSDVSKLYRYDELNKHLHDLYTSDIHSHINPQADVENGIIFRHDDDDVENEDMALLDEWTKIEHEGNLDTDSIKALIDNI